MSLLALRAGTFFGECLLATEKGVYADSIPTARIAVYHWYSWCRAEARSLRRSAAGGSYRPLGQSTPSTPILRSSHRLLPRWQDPVRLLGRRFAYLLGHG